jgi:hypothetical protein
VLSGPQPQKCLLTIPSTDGEDRLDLTRSLVPWLAKVHDFAMILVCLGHLATTYMRTPVDRMLWGCQALLPRTQSCTLGCCGQAQIRRRHIAFHQPSTSEARAVSHGIELVPAQPQPQALILAALAILTARCGWQVTPEDTRGQCISVPEHTRDDKGAVHISAPLQCREGCWAWPTCSLPTGALRQQCTALRTSACTVCRGVGRVLHLERAHAICAKGV